jgi:hypothetical protein
VEGSGRGPIWGTIPKYYTWGTEGNEEKRYKSYLQTEVLEHEAGRSVYFVLTVSYGWTNVYFLERKFFPTLSDWHLGYRGQSNLTNKIRVRQEGVPTMYRTDDTLFLLPSSLVFLQHI